MDKARLEVASVKPRDLRYDRGLYVGECVCGLFVNTTQSYCSSCGIGLDWVLDESQITALRQMKGE